MGEEFYAKDIKCPICNNRFSTTKVKKSACIVDKRDEDFCVHYKTHNPIFYDIIVCPFCGYAASENSFNDLTEQEIKKMKEVCSGFKVGRDFCNERTINDAIDSYKIALYMSKAKEAKDSIIAGTCLRIAWLYRMLKDPLEMTFLEYALENYEEAYSVERFPIGNFDEITMQYMLGELSRRVGKYSEAVTWFSKAVSNPQRLDNPRIENAAREQWMLVKEQLRKIKKTETN